MILERTYSFNTKHTIDAIKKRLLGNKLEVHNIEFEITERDNIIKIIPHAENLEGVKTLPITHIKLNNNTGDKTKVTIRSKPRKIDAGGPYVIMIFSLFLILGSSGFYFIMKAQKNGDNLVLSSIMFGIGVFIFLIFWVKMQSGYFDYIRKIRSYVTKSLA